MTTNQTIPESARFASDVIWVGMSNLLAALVGIITMPLMTKTYTTEIYGIWSQVLATVLLLVPVVTLQFTTCVVRYLAGEDDPAIRRRSLGTMLSTILIFSCLLLFVANILAPQISSLLFDSATQILFVRLTLAWIFVDSLYMFFISYLRARGRIKLLSINGIILSIVKTVAIGVLVLTGMELAWIIGCMVLVEIGFVVYVLGIIVRADGFPIMNFTGLKEFLGFSLPQVPVGIMSWITNVSDRYFITHLLNLSLTGIYSSSNLLASFIAIFYAPIGFVLLPAVSRAWEQNRKKDTILFFEYSTKLFLTVAIPAVIGLAMLSQPLLRILATSEYLVGIPLVLLLAISQIFMGIFQINQYVAYLVKQTQWIPLIILGSTAISIGLNYALIPHYGILGAAISKVVSFFVLAIVMVIWTKRLLSYSFNLRYTARIVIAALVMTVCVYFLRVDSAGGIVIAIVVGVVIFAGVLLLLRSFNDQDRRLIRQMLGMMFPWLKNGNAGR
jgi:O-antigen/teichoic acid export membrane protein